MALVVWMVTETVVMAVGETLMVVGEKVQAAPNGRPVHARLMLPLKPFAGAVLIVVCVEPPAVTVAPPEEVLKLKVGVLPAVVTFVMPAKRP